MLQTQVTLKFVVAQEKVQEFIDRMAATASQLEDEWRCPAVAGSGEDMRCELPRDHDEKRHRNGNLSWPVVADSKTSLGYLHCGRCGLAKP